MYIFLDESKLLTKKWWKFILGWLITSLKPWTIDNLYKGFLEHTWIKEKGWEIKSYDWEYKKRIDDFYMYIKSWKYSEKIEFVWLFAKNYKENWESYYECLKILLIHTLKFNKINSKFEKINIIADNIKLNYKQEKIKLLLNNEIELENIKIHKWFTFKFANSKNNSWIKFSDFVAWILREKYISERYDRYRNFEEYCVNKEISFIKIK